MAEPDDGDPIRRPPAAAGRVVAEADTDGDPRRRRRRHYRTIARLLKDYTRQLYRIAHHVGVFEDRLAKAKSDGESDGYFAWLVGRNGRGAVPWTVAVAVRRLAAIHYEVTRTTQFASGMIAHYDLDEAEKAELRLRLFDAEQALEAARYLAKLGDKHKKLGVDLDEPRPANWEPPGGPRVSQWVPPGKR